MLNNLKYKFHRIGFYIYSVKYYYEDNHKEKGVIRSAFKAIFKNLKIFNYKNGYYEYLEIPITNRCSLRCKDCFNLIPYYKKRCDYDLDTLTKSIKTFLTCISNIVYVRVLGGEPFLSSNIVPILKQLIKSDKIQRIEIVTNGTVVPKDKELIKLMQNPRVMVSISVYPMVNCDRLVEVLKENNIKYHLDKATYWLSPGEPTKRNRTFKELKKQFRQCSHVCKSLVNGQVHYCPRSSHGMDLGLIENNPKDYVNLLDKKTSIKEKQKQLAGLYKKKCITACDYCDFGTKLGKRIPVAEQIEK